MDNATSSLETLSADLGARIAAHQDAQAAEAAAAKEAGRDFTPTPWPGARLVVAAPIGDMQAAHDKGQEEARSAAAAEKKEFTRQEFPGICGHSAVTAAAKKHRVQVELLAQTEHYAELRFFRE